MPGHQAEWIGMTMQEAMGIKEQTDVDVSGWLFSHFHAQLHNRNYAFVGLKFIHVRFEPAAF